MSELTPEALEKELKETLEQMMGLLCERIDDPWNRMKCREILRREWRKFDDIVRRQKYYMKAPYRFPPDIALKYAIEDFLKGK